MGIFEITEKYQDKKLYNMIEVTENFKKYFNMSLEELENYFKNYFVVEKEDILKCLSFEKSECTYLKEMVNNKTIEYDYYRKVLDILSTKALAYLKIIKYLCDCKEKNNSYEQILEEAQIYHYSSIMIGKDVNKILIVLFHLLKSFSSTLDVINQKDNFLSSRMSMGLLNYDEEEIYPSEKLIITDDYYTDKTSFFVKRKIR